MQNVVRDGNYGRAKDTQKIYSKYIYNRVTIFDEWIKRISPSFLPVVKIWFSIKKKKEKRREDPSGNGESEIERNDLEKLGRTWLGKFNELVPRSFLLFHFHLETVEEPSSEGLRGAARCETGAQKRSFTRGNDAREKEKKVGGRRRRQVKKRERV